jgi:hypothetical protein
VAERSLATSLDGQWAVARNGVRGAWLARGAGPSAGDIALDVPTTGNDVELALIGPPTALVVATHVGNATRIALYEPPVAEAPPRPEPTARLDLDGHLRLVAATGPRLAFAAPDNQHITVVRAAPHALAHQMIDLAQPFDVGAGMPRDQLMFALPKEAKVWDAVSGKPLMKLALALPPPPRIVGTAGGHLWAMRPAGTEMFVYRLSDGRPFRHPLGVRIDHVISHAMSPVLVLVTERGLVRLHCYAHSLTLIELPSAPPFGGAARSGGGGPIDGVPNVPSVLAQLVVGDDISLLGLTETNAEPWRVAIGGAGAPLVPVAEPETSQPLVTAADKLRAMRAGPDGPPAGSSGAAGPDELPVMPVAAAGSVPIEMPAPLPRGEAWREGLARYAAELVRGSASSPPAVPEDSEVARLADELALPAAARRALTALYALYLVGEPAIAIARLAHATSDWDEALGRGQLARLAMLERHGGKVQLQAAVTDVLDGAAPRAVRMLDGARATRDGAVRVSRDGRTDAEIEAALASQLGRLAIATGDPVQALLEARMRGATCVAFTTPAERPSPWPAGACLVLVLYASPSAWLADLPALTAS